MPVVRVVHPASHRLLAGLTSIVVLALTIDHAVALPLADEVGSSPIPLVEVGRHLVVSEVMTGGASASDEFIELHNPTEGELPLEGLEVVYVTATGATITRKAEWAAGAAPLPAGGHVLIANGAGIFASLADVGYANGLAATGGSVALRVIGAATAIDAVGWGNATSSWLETRPAPAPASGSSLERLPGGSGGSGQDTDDNLIDFFVQSFPDPQNSASPPIPGSSGSPAPTASPTQTPVPSGSPSAQPSVEPSPSETPVASSSPEPTATAEPTPTPTPTATPAPTPAPVSIADARSQADGGTVTTEGMALTASDFTDGGGYIVDASAGIAVLVSDGAFARGALLRVSGTVDDRYAQRTIRATGETITILGSASEPLPLDAATGAIGEAFEGRLVEVTGSITSSVTTLSTGLAWDLDDGTGASRVLVANGAGIDTSSWERGVGLTIVGVVGQRDSSGSGTTGYRIQPRDGADVLAVVPVATPGPSSSAEPSASPTGSTSPSPSAGPTAPLVSIGEARAAATGTRLRIRGVVTAPSGLIETGSAVVQDATAAILVRIGTDLGSLALGQLVELDGTRATKAGMLSLRVSTAPLHLGTQAGPDAVRRATGALGEAEEARLVTVRGAIRSAISRPRGGSVSFAINDGSGAIRVTVSSRSSIPTAALARGSWVELSAVLAQETTGSSPTSGYRLWPRIPADLRLIAAAVGGAAGSTLCCTGGETGSRAPGSGNLPDALVDSATQEMKPGTVPVLARQLPTSSPPGISTATQEAVTAEDPAAPAVGLVVSGMGLAALAGLAAWYGRRRPEDDPSTAMEVPDVPRAPDSMEAAGPTRLPRLSVLRGETTDAREERRILPPT